MNTSVISSRLLSDQALTKQALSQPRHWVFSHFPDVPYNVIGLAASFGGLKAISTIVSALPSDFPAAIVIVQHLPANLPSYLTEILSDRTSLQVKPAEDGELLRRGTVYTPVPNKHVLIKPDGTLSLSDSAKVSFSRPAADKLFWSLANSYKSRAIAVVLTGRMTDGALGVLAIKRQGGIILAQDENTAECFSMPKAAIDTQKVDQVLPLDAIAPALIHLVNCTHLKRA
ncbi:chemotaxis protein CheB [Aphanothece hegewaldii CCALA 016]|uniref:protein-glutamate methylesterase n=1 Tax=Aphanothece hegewaldii CCALA 016 TaxID=2107694 RepID=A0A2T1LYF6_9CHRO|nr:chemotaxis protein CheB [Aphanothece hegewaldii]PSF37432.1 chemotaxis protein CheB [Aphanothece hegewaldii CCALA 016]